MWLRGTILVLMLVGGLSQAVVTVRARAGGARAKSLFGPPLKVRHKTSFNLLRRYRVACPVLSKKPEAPSRGLRARAAIPDHPGLAWGMTLPQARWVLDKLKWPHRVGCVARRNLPYLSLQRRLSKWVKGASSRPIQVLLKFRTGAPKGLYLITALGTYWAQGQVDALVRGARQRYGPAKRRRVPKLLLPVWTYRWVLGSTRVQLTHARVLRRQSNVSFRFTRK